MKANRELRKCGAFFCSGKNKRALAMTAVLLLVTTAAVLAQDRDAGAGITEAEQKVAGYFDVGTQLVYAIGAVAGLIGAVKVYNKWNQGDQDTSKVAASWFGSCIFLVVVATVLRAFFL